MLPKDLQLSQLLSQRPGIETLTQLVEIHPYELSPSGRIDYLAALEKQNGWLQALMQTAFVAIADDQRESLEYGESGVDDEEREEIAAALRLSPATAQAKMDTARILVNQLPATCAALASGEISVAHATVIARESAPLLRGGIDREVIAQIEKSAIANAEFHTPAQVANKIRTAVSRALPTECEESFARAHELRKVSCYPERDGMATVIALLSAPDAQSVLIAIERHLQRKDREALQSSSSRNSIATQNSTSSQTSATTQNSFVTTQNSSVTTQNSLSRGTDLANSAEIPNPWRVDNRRADAFVEIINEFLTSDVLDQTATDQTATDQTATDQTATDQTATDQTATDQTATDQTATDQTDLTNRNLSKQKQIKNLGRKPVTINVTIDLPTLLNMAENPGQLSGYGPIPASLARELAADGNWKRFITDPTSGELLDIGRKSYRPSQHLVDFLIARDRTCRFPGCRYPAHRSDIDHVTPWDDGGKTTPENLGSLCRRHHRLKTHGGWKVTSARDGSCEWISPNGKHYLVPSRPVHEAA
jgi:hypothetical protein